MLGKNYKRKGANRICHCRLNESNKIRLISLHSYMYLKKTKI